MKEEVTEGAKLSMAERELQTERLYSKVGKIVVLSEHLNYAMYMCCCQILSVRGLSHDYCQAALIGQNLESMRRVWESMIKLFFADDRDANGMIDHISTRIDNVIRRRNDTVHHLWFIGWGNEQTESYEIARSMKGKRSIGKKGRGGVEYTQKDTTDFDEIIDEVQKLNAIVWRFHACVASVMSGKAFKPVANFHYNEKNELIDKPPRKDPLHEAGASADDCLGSQGENLPL